MSTCTAIHNQRVWKWLHSAGELLTAVGPTSRWQPRPCHRVRLSALLICGMCKCSRCRRAFWHATNSSWSSCPRGKFKKLYLIQLPLLQTCKRGAARAREGERRTQSPSVNVPLESRRSAECTRLLLGPTFPENVLKIPSFLQVFAAVFLRLSQTVASLAEVTVPPNLLFEQLCILECGAQKAQMAW